MKEVENELGQGHFVLQVQLGTAVFEVPVQAVNIRKPGEVDRYFRGAQRSGELIRAVRYGKKGMCGFRINPTVVDAEMEINTINFPQSGIRPLWRVVNGPDLISQNYTIDALDTLGDEGKPNMQIKGIFHNEQFIAKIIFVSSPQ